jgi:hypothetical protein
VNPRPPAMASCDRPQLSAIAREPVLDAVLDTDARLGNVLPSLARLLLSLAAADRARRAGRGER